MVQAYRLLVAEMYVQGWDYPLHLGVTEAGEGEDGRMKSAIGIGTLLQVLFESLCSGVVIDLKPVNIIKIILIYMRVMHNFVKLALRISICVLQLCL